MAAHAWGLLLTIAVYEAAKRLHKSRPSGLLLPIAVAPLVLVALLTAAGAEYGDYSKGAGMLTSLLGPATVAMAVPLYLNRHRLRENALAILAGVTVGTLWGAVSGILVGKALGLDAPVIGSLAPRSITTPIAMEVAGTMGASPALAAVFVIVTGVLGSCIGPWLADALGLRGACARGVMFGTGAHGAGTARIMGIDGTAGAYSTVSMTLAAILGYFLIPPLARILGI